MYCSQFARKGDGKRLLRHSITNRMAPGWTCFIAGSEAMLPYLQQRALRYLRVFDQNGSFWAPKGAVEVVQEIWRRRQSSGEWAISWPDVMLATPS